MSLSTSRSPYHDQRTYLITGSFDKAPEFYKTYKKAQILTYPLRITEKKKNLQVDDLHVASCALTIYRSPNSSHSPCKLFQFRWSHYTPFTFFCSRTKRFLEDSRSSVKRKKESSVAERVRLEDWSEEGPCCMSKDCKETYCGGIGELANPLQWPQLRKRRRFLLSALRHSLKILFLFLLPEPLWYGIGVVISRPRTLP